MPSRFLPHSTPTRFRALKMVDDRKAVTLPANLPFTPATVTRFDAFFPAYKAKYLAVNSALAVQAAKTEQVKQAKQFAAWIISDMIDAMQNAVRRGAFPASVRALYQLPVGKPHRPRIDTEQDVLDWGERVHDGETARIAAGGAPITFPSLAEVDAAVDNFKNLNLEQAAAKDAYDNALEAIEADSIEADKLILKLWNEIETAYDEGNKPSMRRKAREWGVVYIPSPGEVPSADEYSIVGTITDSTTNEAMGGVQVKIAETDEVFVTESDGRFFVPIQPPGTYTLYIQHTGYQNQVVNNIIVNAGELNELFITLIPAGGFGAISGTVQQAGAGVAASVSVEGTALIVSTDPATGAFIIPNVPAGAQFVRAILDADPTQVQARLTEVTTGETKIENFSFA